MVLKLRSKRFCLQLIQGDFLILTLQTVGCDCLNDLYSGLHINHVRDLQYNLANNIKVLKRFDFYFWTVTKWHLALMFDFIVT